MSEGVMFRNLSTASAANRRLWVCTFLTLGVVAVVSTAFYFVPGMHTSVLTIVTSLFTSGPKSAGGKALSSVFYGIFYALLFTLFIVLAYEARRKKTDRIKIFDGIFRAALKEEVKYRQGAEDWSWKRRLWTQARFGAAHFWNLIVPLNVVVGLACVGFCYMAFYLELRSDQRWDQAEATQITALIHARYNATLMVGVMGGGWVFIIGDALYHVVA